MKQQQQQQQDKTDSFHHPQIDIMWYWHRIRITPQAERRIWESAVSASRAVSHTYTSLQTHSSLFDIANCRLIGATTACGNAASGEWVHVYKRVASRNNGSTFRLTAPLTYSRTAAKHKYEMFKQGVCAAAVWFACVSALLEGRAVGCARTAEGWGDMLKSERDGRPDMMWHQLPLCHFVFTGGGFRASDKRCLPPSPNATPTLMWNSLHTHTLFQWCEYSERTLSRHVWRGSLSFHFLWNFSLCTVWEERSTFF